MNPVLTELHATARRNELLLDADRRRRTREVRRPRVHLTPAVQAVRGLLARSSVRRHRPVEPAHAA